MTSLLKDIDPQALLETDSVPVGEFAESRGGMHVQPKCEERHKQSLDKCVETREECSDDNVVFLERKPSRDSNIDKILSRMIRTAEEGNNDVEDLMTKVRVTENRVNGKGSKVETAPKRENDVPPQPKEKSEVKPTPVEEEEEKPE